MLRQVCFQPVTAAVVGHQLRHASRFTTLDLVRACQRADAIKLTMVTAYDAPMAAAAARAEVELVLVGDSAGMVVHGRDTTVGVSLDDMVLHSASVVRGVRAACAAYKPANVSAAPCLRAPLVIGDLPFGAAATVDEAVKSSVRLMTDGHVDCVKLEGGRRAAPHVQAVVDAGIAVIGHIGLTPQSHAQLGGWRMQGRDAASAMALLYDALALQRAGVSAIVLELVHPSVAALVSRSLHVPTIGIGSGLDCSGQVLVSHDLLGLGLADPMPTPSFVKQYANAGRVFTDAYAAYRRDVRSGVFPSAFGCKAARKFDPATMESVRDAMRNGDHGEYAADVQEAVRLLGDTATTAVATSPAAAAAAAPPAVPPADVVVIGAGSIGTLLAARIKQCTNLDVSLVTRRADAVADTIRQHGGLLVRELDDSTSIVPGVSVLHDLSSVPEPATDSWQLLLLATRATPGDIDHVAASLLPSLLRHPQRTLLSLQNGFAPAGVAAQDAAHGVTYLGAHDGGTGALPGRVVVAGAGETVLPPLPGHAARVHGVAKLLLQCGLPASVADDAVSMHRHRWRKAGANCVINPITALLDLPNGVLADATLRPLIDRVVDEIAAVAAADGAPGLDLVIRDAVDATVAATAANTSSMRRHLYRRCGFDGTECDAILGHVVRLAERYGIAVGATDTLLTLVRAADAQQRRGLGNTAPARALRVCHDVSDVREQLDRLCGTGVRGARRSLALVPTMGALHHGHLDLVREAKRQADVVCVSIFVNPTQFAPGEDLDAYPRQMEHDLAALRKLDVDVVFAPHADTFYPPGFGMFITPRGHCGDGDSLSGTRRYLPEGDARPHFFRGVATVVGKLLNVVQPDVAVFGQKDAQQCIVVRQLVNELNFPTRIHIAPTRREHDGLAMASRNAYLTPGQRQAAPVVYQSLSQAESLLAAGQHAAPSPAELRSAVHSVLAASPAVSSIDYVSVCDADDGFELNDADAWPARVCVSVAVRMAPESDVPGSKEVRLIDNTVVSVSS